MEKNILTIVSLFLSATTMLFSQERINNKDVIKMKQFGLSDRLIETKIKAFDPNFDISDKSIVAFRETGLSDDIVSLIIERQTKLQKLIDNTFYLTSLELINNEVIINDSIMLQQGDSLEVYLPYNRNKDFITIEPKAGLLSLKSIGKMADIVGTGALAVALGTNSVGTGIGAMEVLSKTQSIAYGIEAMEKINDLPISKNAKKIAGKTLLITEILVDEYGDVQIEGLIEKKKYIAVLREALILGEVKLQPKYNQNGN